MGEQSALSFASLLRQLRADARLTQEELAEAARLSARSVSDLERGVNRSARKDTALLLADALGLAGPKREMFIAVARGKPLPIRPNNLPAQLTSFVGREIELSEVRALVPASRLVTLTGAGGSGKTRLSLQVAGELLDAWADGVWLVELAAVTGQDAVPAAIAGALGIPAQPGQPVLDTLADALGPQDMLIVVDNCEHLIGGCAKTAETILQSCPQVHLIATSREPLGIGGERLYRVPPLSLPELGDADDAAARSCDAVALLADRAGAHGVSLDLTSRAIALALSVCRRLDGMPLAIELAAARLRSMSLGELSGRLDQRFRLLTGGSRTAAARQQTLLATVGWSYSLLSPAEQLLLARLSVFAGGFDLAAAEAVCGYETIDAAEVAMLLGSLVDKSLVVTEPASNSVRYGLLETIRLFAAEQLAETEQEPTAAREAHCVHFLAAAEAAAPHLRGSEQGIWLDRLEADHANLRRAAEHGASQPDGTSRVLRFAIALWRYWVRHYRHEEAAGLLVPVLRRPEAAADPALFAEALQSAALVTSDIDLTLSMQLAEQMDQVAASLGDDRLLILCRSTRAFLYSRVNDPERARPLAQDSLDRARKLGDDAMLVAALVPYIFTVDAAAALPLYAEAIACSERTGDLGDLYNLHNNVGWLTLLLGDIPGARAHLEAAIRVAQVMRYSPASATATLGLVRRAEHDSDGARSAFEQAIRTSRRFGAKLPMAEAVLGLACLAADMGEWHRAATLHGAAQALVEQTGNSWDPNGWCCRKESLGQIAAAIGDEQLERAHAQGAVLSIDDAIDLALGRSSPP